MTNSPPSGRPLMTNAPLVKHSTLQKLGGMGLHYKSSVKLGDDKTWSPNPWSTLWST